MLATIDPPISLPNHWGVESSLHGTVLVARRADGEVQGYVTVCERLRGFALGISYVRVNVEDEQYAGHGWREHLYSDAIEALQEAVGPLKVAA